MKSTIFFPPKNGFYVFNISLFTYQARLRLSGHINSQNSRLRSAENPHELHENPLHSLKSVFRALCLENGLWNHCFFRTDKEGRNPFQHLL